MSGTLTRLLDGDVQIWQGDAEALLPQLPLDIDLLLTDPPFGREFRSNRVPDAEAIVGDADQAKVTRILAGCWQHLRPHRHGYVFGPERELSNSRTCLIWDRVYMSSGDLAATWGTSHIPIWFYAHQYRSEPRAGALSARLRRGTVIREPAARGSADLPHPNHKPVRLWQRLIEASTVVGDLVVDPFCGSGSSAVAAILSGRRYIGIEIDPVYAERAAAWALKATKLVEEASSL